MRKLIMKTTRPSFESFKAKALKNPEVKAEYDSLKPIVEIKQHKATQEGGDNLFHTKSTPSRLRKVKCRVSSK